MSNVIPLSVGDSIEVLFHDLGVAGEGIGSCRDFVVFAPGVLPGERALIAIESVKPRYAKGRLIRVLEASKHRIHPPCPVFGRCGGCQIMHMDRQGQLEWKHSRVVAALKRLGKLSDIPVDPCRASPAFLGYRNKMQIPIALDNRGQYLFGLYARDSHDIVPIDHCPIHCLLGESVFALVRQLAEQSLPSKEGASLRYLLIKSAVESEQVLVGLIGTSPLSPALKEFARELMAREPKMRGVVHYYQAEVTNSIVRGQMAVVAGEPFIAERLGEFTYKISASAFFQVNPAQAQALYTKALELAALEPSMTVVDAYCGVGTLSLPIAARVREVIGIEVVPEAIADARENAALNRVDNVSFVCGAVEKVLGEKKRADVVILNPPRQGCQGTVLQALQVKRPDRIVYISCDPATLARDMRLLVDKGFKAERVCPFDMFPQTTHVECVALLS